MFKLLLATAFLALTQIPGFVEWNGPDPYPMVDWSYAKAELLPLVNKFEKKWGSPLIIRQVYRSPEYGAHLRSSWELWRWMNGQSFTEGYGCLGYEHINPDKIKSLTYFQRKIIESEAERHAFWNDGTPPACQSDHALGIAVDISPPWNPVEYRRWIKTGVSVGLCHYIRGDEPHWGITAYLPPWTDCLAE